MSEPPEAKSGDDCVLRVSNLQVSYSVGFWGTKKVALRGATFDVRRNEIFGYIGANGAGKTTTIKTLVGLQHPQSGSVEILGRPVTSAASRARVGFLPENPYFYEYLTAREALHFYGQLCGVKGSTLTSRSNELLEQVQLEHAADRPIRGYSKGMRQRLGLAQALINDPELVILDEPMSGLDPLGRAQVREIILDMATRGRTVFFSSHILSDVEAICSRVAHIHLGEIRAVGQLSELLGREVRSVDVVGRGLSDDLAADLSKKAKHASRSGDEVYLQFLNESDAQVAAQQIVSGGGQLLKLLPHHESLEDLFLETATAQAGGAAS